MGYEKNGQNEEFQKQKIKKGEVRNPNGRPKTFLGKFKDEWTKQLAEEYGVTPTKKDVNDVLFILINMPKKKLLEMAGNMDEAPAYAQIVAEALTGDKSFFALESVFDRIYGRPAQQQAADGTTAMKMILENETGEPPIV